MPESLPLTIELVPQTSWYDNMRKALPKTEWDRLRQRTYAAYGHQCGICGAKGKLHCHERWVYDEHTRTQTLIGFIALCEWCHHVKHIGLAGVLASRGQIRFECVIRHFMKVNNCDRRTFEAHENAAFDLWDERSRHDWRVDLGAYARMGKEDESGSG